MKPSRITPLVLAKLGFPSPMDYDVKPDQSLAVIDSNGQKFVIPYKDYAALLPETKTNTAPIKKSRKTA